MRWQLPPPIKVYEALGAIADKRIVVRGNTAKVYSSSGNKHYEVTYDPKQQAITANDNGSYWQGYLGYPSISFLLAKGYIIYNKKTAVWLKDIAWKDINTQFKNNFAKTEQYIHELVQQRGGNVEILLKEAEHILTELGNLKLKKLPSTLKPPKGY